MEENQKQKPEILVKIHGGPAAEISGSISNTLPVRTSHPLGSHQFSFDTVPDAFLIHKIFPCSGFSYLTKMFDFLKIFPFFIELNLEPPKDQTHRQSVHLAGEKVNIFATAD